MVNQIYPSELQLNKANISDTEAPFLDLHLSVANGFVSSKQIFHIACHQILGTIPRGGARGQNLGHIYNMIDTKFAHVLNAREHHLCLKVNSKIKKSNSRIPMVLSKCNTLERRLQM